jgi:DNA-binding winged helix-turn-helix (wHTH) protein/TolB-like protein
MDGLEYRIGRFTLKPFRQLLDGEAPVSIGRKALDLLSVLARAEGALVTKDELFAAVWPNAIVEDNAIQVHIAALRKALGQDAGLLTTVHGLGYRLAVANETPSLRQRPEAPEEALPAAAPSRRIAPILSAAFSLIAIAAASLWPVRDHLPWTTALRPSDARVAVLPFDALGPGADSHDFADGLLDRIVSELSDNQVQAISRTDSPALRGANAGRAIDRLGADLLLDGTVRNDGKTIDVSVHLDDAREHVIVWSEHFQGSAGATDALQANVAAHAANAARWAKLARSGSARLDAASLAAFIAGRESITTVRNASVVAALSNYQKVVAASPDFSWGHSAVASAAAFEALENPTAPQSEVLRNDARREARRALALDPHNGEAYLALSLSSPVHAWKEREALMLQGAAADPGFEPDALMEGRLLWVVGRVRDALPWLQRAHDLDPLHNNTTWSLALILASDGRPADSRMLVSQMEVEWPEQFGTKDARFWTSVVENARRDTLALLADPAARPAGMDQTAVDAWRAALKASPADRNAKAGTARLVMAAAAGGSLSHGQALTLLAMLGDLDDAFAQAQLYEPLDAYTAPFLFLPPTAPLRADPRFMAVAGRLGIVAYWRSTGQWPDFCSEPGLPYDCRREAARVAARLTSSPIGSGY